MAWQSPRDPRGEARVEARGEDVRRYSRIAPKENKYENKGTDNMTAILIRFDKK